jgi:hypothetical protein
MMASETLFPNIK